MEGNDLITIQQAVEEYSKKYGVELKKSSISYLLSYGRIDAFKSGRNTLVSRKQLDKYYQDRKKTVQDDILKKVSGDGNVNERIFFNKVNETKTLKHVNGLHTYVGKYIPQLVEYFLDANTDEFKKEQYFKPGDIVLDPFCGSGTTLVQANELGIDAIGIDLSEVGAMISNCKVSSVDLNRLKQACDGITERLLEFNKGNGNLESFLEDLKNQMTETNSENFGPEYMKGIYDKAIDGKDASREFVQKLQVKFDELAKKHGLQLFYDDDSYMSKWFSAIVLRQADFLNGCISEIEDEETRNVLRVMLSSSIRAARLVRHADMSHPDKPVKNVYYCRKHMKICKPVFDITKFWRHSCSEFLKKIGEFRKIRTNTFQHCFTGDSTSFDISGNMMAHDKAEYQKMCGQKIAGIFSSPPYIGVLDYQDQHEYDYFLFNMKKTDEKQIGSAKKGKSKKAIQDYITLMADVLVNCKRYLKDGFNIFLVANDSYGIYGKIAQKAGLEIRDRFERPVFNSNSAGGNAFYTETVFHMVEGKKIQEN